MKKISTLASILFFAVGLYAQNVGIGTLTPTSSFEIKKPLKSTLKISTTQFTDTTQLIFSNRDFLNQGTDMLVSSNQEEGLRFSSSSDLPANTQNNIMQITPQGNVGIGTVPAEKLEVNGNAKINGEVNRPSTGSANLVPIAYGTIFTDGTLYANSGNISCIRSAAGSYEITISGENYFYLNYITTVTQSLSSPKIITTNSVSGKLLVYSYNLAGVLVDSVFSFITYKP